MEGFKPNRRQLCAVLLTVTFVLSAYAGLSTAAQTAVQRHIPKKESEVPRISSEDLKDRLIKGELILIVDVRSIKAFETQHIVGAISVPLSQVKSRLNEFPRDREIVFY
ncbi:MAG: rhodanese-like domain-containing protein [Thermodesulfovibrionia bacterium]|nr:rhodanese-like domain-containing protein [Thermodesulfovibrionia bacterium]MCK5426652.1 rhodanese-like domain-containing protein [Thermodesulfovibrionia bacterium]